MQMLRKSIRVAGVALLAVCAAGLAIRAGAAFPTDGSYACHFEGTPLGLEAIVCN